ncbi:hypothetical protein DRF60_15025 [Chryseobacterium elymi]|uniref:Uncharacterized protein n=1 Tax=Chryseobacterium elymi TaxID=395936 RepID=A0A3D9DD84_9FLAO|nr:hypothetical protein [Chryseobacterium elymi]REC75821.1 hypothetical protein DRF60_15025 [Chryseobacterium elymi]
MDTINKIRPAALEEAFKLRPAQNIKEISLYESRMNNDVHHHSNQGYFVPGTVSTEVESRELEEIEQSKEYQEFDNSLQRIEVHQELKPMEVIQYEHTPSLKPIHKRSISTI